MKNKANVQKFEVLQEQTNSDEAKQIERQWKKKVQKEKDNCYTKLMIIAIGVMALIFIILISFLADGKKQHVELEFISYKNTDYVYLQSNFPHLKFLYPKNSDSLEVKLLRNLGIIYSELITWIESNIQQNNKILFIPNEKSGVNVLGISLGYYLRGSSGGSLDIGVTQIKFKEMTQKNVQLMNKARPQGYKFPINLINLYQNMPEYDKYNLIIVQNNYQYKKILNAQNTKIIILNKKNIQPQLFPQHRRYGIIKGKTNFEVRQFDIKYGYAIVPYNQKDSTTTQIALLLPKSIQDVEQCQQKKIQLLAPLSVMRNLVVYLQNKTFTESTIYYGVENSAALSLIARIPTISKLYSKISSTQSNVIEIKNNNLVNFQQNTQITLSKVNYYIVNYNPQTSYKLNNKDTLLILLNNDEQARQLLKKYPNQQVNMISPYNNKGCYYPPAISTYKKMVKSVPFFMMLSNK